MKLPPSTETYMRSTAESVKANADAAVGRAVQQLSRDALTRMFQEGYARALQDHDIKPDNAE